MQEDLDQLDRNGDVSRRQTVAMLLRGELRGGLTRGKKGIPIGGINGGQLQRLQSSLRDMSKINAHPIANTRGYGRVSPSSSHRLGRAAFLAQRRV